MADEIVRAIDLTLGIRWTGSTLPRGHGPGRSALVSSTEDAELRDRATELLELRGAVAGGADPE